MCKRRWFQPNVLIVLSAHMCCPEVVVVGVYLAVAAQLRDTTPHRLLVEAQRQLDTN